MKKLLIVTTISGTLRSFLLPFARYFRERGWQVDGMAQGVSACADCLQAFDRVWEIEWSRNPLDLKNLSVAPQKIREIVDREQYDLIHVHTPVAAFVTRYALKDVRAQGKCKVIYTAHGFHFHPGGNGVKNTLFLTLEKLAANWTDYLVTINHVDRAAAIDRQLMPPAAIRYMPGIGIDTDYYHPDHITELEVEKVRQELGLSADLPMLLCIAYFDPGKRHRDILKALAKLNRPDFCMAFAGKGPLFEELRQLASELRVADRVRFLGERNDIRVLIRAARATILVSEREGLSRSVLESLSLEVPVIGTKIRGIEESISDGCGLKVEVGDSQGIASAIAWVLDHPQETQAMGKRGREKMVANYELRQIISLHEDLYREAMSQLTTCTCSKSPSGDQIGSQ